MTVKNETIPTDNNCTRCKAYNCSCSENTNDIGNDSRKNNNTGLIATNDAVITCVVWATNVIDVMSEASVVAMFSGVISATPARWTLIDTDDVDVTGEGDDDDVVRPGFTVNGTRV